MQLTGAYILEQTGKNKPFDQRIQRWMADQEWTFVRTPHEEWVKAVDNMAKTLAYVWANRLIFYKALRARFTDLPRLELRRSVKNPDEALAAFNRLFQKAVERSGDYEPLLMPEAKDWATSLVFYPPTRLGCLARGAARDRIGGLPRGTVRRGRAHLPEAHRAGRTPPLRPALHRR